MAVVSPVGNAWQSVKFEEFQDPTFSILRPICEEMASPMDAY